MKRQSVRRFASDESGQIMLLFLFMVLLALAILMLNLNTGTVLQDKLRTQNAADMSSLSGGAWMARCLNHISMNNVAMTHTLAWILILRGVKDTIVYTGPIARGLQATCCASTATGIGALFTGMCCVAAEIAVLEIQIFEPLVKSEFYNNLISEDKPISLWKLMKVLEYMNELIKYSYPPLAEADAYWIAVKNGADFAILFPYPGLNLPLKRGKFCDLCDPTYRGSPSNPSPPTSIRGYNPLMGYKLDEGPLLRKIALVDDLFWPMLIVGGPFTFRALTKASFGAVCKGCDVDVSDSYEIEEMARNYSEAAARRSEVKESCWIYATATYGPTTKTSLNDDCLLPDPIYSSPDAMKFENVSVPSSYPCGSRYDCSNYPRYPYGDPLYKSAEATTEFITGLDYTAPSHLNSLKKRTMGEASKGAKELWYDCRQRKVSEDEYEYDIEQYHFCYARFKATKKKAEDPAKDIEENKRPKPMLLDFKEGDDDHARVAKLREAFSYISLAVKSKTKLPFDMTLALDAYKPGEKSSGTTMDYLKKFPVVAYSQVRVHNPKSIDLFTQDWHVKLVPADKFDAILDKIDDTIGELPEEGKASNHANSGDLKEFVNYLKDGLNQLNHH